MTNKIVAKTDEYTSINKKNCIHISFSEFSLFNECPHKHLVFKYLKLEEQPPSIHLYFGNAIHEALEMYVKEKYTIQQRIDYFKETFRKNMMDNMKDDKTFKDVDDFIDQGENILTILDTEALLKGYEVFSVEEALYESLHKKFKFKGFIDLILFNPETGMYLIVDWKTSGEAWKVAKKLTDHIFLCQMRFYKYFWGKKHNIPLDKIDCKYVVLNRLKNKKKPKGGFGEVQIVDINSSEDEIMVSLNQLAKTVKNIHIKQEFPKYKFVGGEGFGCLFCKFKNDVHPLCNSKYNQYTELLQQHPKSS